jgi:RsiW-degrading membrane proteinase PrsW (M82 family)
MSDPLIWALVLLSSAGWGVLLRAAARAPRLPAGVALLAFVAGLATAPCVIFLTTMLRVLGLVRTLPDVGSSWAGAFAFFYLSFGVLEELGLCCFAWAVLSSLRLRLAAAPAGWFAASAALGFAALENGRYLVSLSLEQGPHQVLDQQLALTLVGRFVLAVLLHVACALCWGPWVAPLAPATARPTRRLVAGVLAGTFVHALYDVLILKDHLGWACFLLGAACTGTLRRQYELSQVR